MNSHFNTAINDFFVNITGGIIEYVLSNSQYISQLGTVDRVNYVVAGLGMNRPAQPLGAMSTGLASLGMGSSMGPNMGMGGLPMSGANLPKPASSRSKNKVEKNVMSVDEYFQARSRDDKICAYMARGGAHKGTVCGAPAINVNPANPQDNPLLWRCTADTGKIGIIEKHMKPAASGQTNPAVLGLNVPGLGQGQGMGQILGQGMGLGMGQGMGSILSGMSNMGLGSGGIGSLQDLTTMPMMGGSLGGFESTQVIPQLVATQTTNDKSLYVATVNGVARIVVQDTGAAGLVCRGRLGALPVFDQSKCVLPDDWDKTLVAFDNDDQEFMRANSIRIA
jgi:hypothetical protein